MAGENADTIESATVKKRANIYYDGNVTSRSIETGDSDRVTLGIMRPGQYTFETDERERIEIMQGELTVEFGNDRSEYAAGESFSVPPDTEFQLTVSSLIDYICTYG